MLNAVVVWMGLIMASQAPSSPTLDRSETTRNIFGLEAAPLDEPLVGDRPDFTESPYAVPRGRFQLESGYTFTFDREDGERAKAHTFPEFLLRVGLAEGLELRLGWEGWTFSETLSRERNDVGRTVSRNPHRRDGADMIVGFKYELLEEDGWIPDFGVIGELSLPTGGVQATSGDVDPAVKWLWAYSLTDQLSVAGNVNLAAPTGENGRFFQAGASLSFAYALTDRLGTYAEYFGLYPNDRDSDAAHALNGGFTYLITPNLQFDVRAGFGLNEEADDFFVGTGFVIRM